MGRREQNKAKKNAALLQAGLELFLEGGVERTSIEQIAAKAGVARGPFYLYYDTKEALFETIVDGFLDPLMQIFDRVEAGLANADGPGAALSVYQVMAAELAMLGLSHQQRVLLLFREMRGPSMDGLRARELALIERITELTRLAMDRGLVEQGDPQLASLVILGGIERLYFEVLIGELELGSPAELASKAALLLSRVLGVG